ncbi:MAG: DNA-directed RNA polymerase subunit K [Thaumarchaeota archaeon]|jgi:DNA-directed RNA polymerase subunit K/omega|nr:DNA-directed RNA polymerase subunit K [Candidatus Geocrenenecus arthurdayi]MCL7388765.1 DNA-directed RNA polymerase subunit K [Candidatus Geocrenenecus arthurdayi]MCL7391184.1 DNA-directed RNA polymerase subunit K [Candidatus Geocrenenecus arthurdayi]MCL7396805.1 DNA-directed RNA polymerase subunit K [Candidatus Geocrenenecus arthurdayi]MCL7402098.1 DNA-directed RNA polymerase subunit K [Candidatus Geocrenenecus arthurdayi]
MEDEYYRRPLTKYEIARIVGGRALQLSLGAFPLVEVKPGDTPIDIAKRELEAGVLPIIIRRRKPDGTYVDIPVNELLKPIEQTVE